MKIRASGFYEGRRRAVTWEDGRLSGDEGAIAVLKSRAAGMGPSYFGPPTGGGFFGEPLELAAGFVSLARELLLGVTFSGDLEEQSPADDAGEDVIF